MGMFDSIAWDAPCPMCNQPVEWQTKQGPQSMTTMTADVFAADVIDNGDGSEDWVHWHTWCSACRLWTEVRTQIRTRNSSGQPETYHAAKVRKATAIRAERHPQNMCNIRPISHASTWLSAVSCPNGQVRCGAPRQPAGVGVSTICAAIRTHAELLSTTGTTDWVSITIHVPTDDWAGYTDDSADHDRGVRVTPATITVYCVAPTEYAALIGALRLYVDSYTGTHISDDRAELIALMGRIDSGVR